MPIQHSESYPFCHRATSSPGRRSGQIPALKSPADLLESTPHDAPFSARSDKALEEVEQATE
jgi:hypothetical protein